MSGGLRRVESGDDGFRHGHAAGVLPDGAQIHRLELHQSLGDESATLNDGDEVAFFPPVTGG